MVVNITLTYDVTSLFHCTVRLKEPCHMLMQCHAQKVYFKAITGRPPLAAKLRSQAADTDLLARYFLRA
jgi:hypothetical protein